MCLFGQRLVVFVVCPWFSYLVSICRPTFAASFCLSSITLVFLLFKLILILNLAHDTPDRVRTVLSIPYLYRCHWLLTDMLCSYSPLSSPCFPLLFNNNFAMRVNGVVFHQKSARVSETFPAFSHSSNSAKGKGNKFFITERTN